MVVARVLAADGKNHAVVEVLRVLKGGYEPGQSVRMQVYGAERMRGKTLILSDPEVFLGPSFEELSLDYEDEVRWLIDRAPVRKVRAALRRIQGLSHESRRAGRAFLASADPFPAGVVLEAIEMCRVAGTSGTYREGCLIDALMLRPHPAASIWVRRRVEAWLAEEGTSEERGRLLTSLVGACGEEWSPMFFTDGTKRPPEARALEVRLTTRLLEAFPTLAPSSQADVTYALAWTGAATPESIRARLREDGDPDGFALGMLRVGEAHRREMASEEATAAWTTARAAARAAELVERIDARLASR